MPAPSLIMGLEMLPAWDLAYDIIKLKLCVDFFHKMNNCPQSKPGPWREHSNFKKSNPEGQRIMYNRCLNK